MTDERVSRDDFGRQRPLNETEQPRRKSYYNAGNVAPNMVDFGFSMMDARMRVIGGLFDVVGNTLTNAGQPRQAAVDDEDDIRDAPQREYGRGRSGDRGRRVATAFGDGIQDATRVVDEIGAAATRSSPRARATQRPDSAPNSAPVSDSAVD
jgi:hypothetical protein